VSGSWIEAQARAEENGAGYSSVEIKDGRISVSAKDVPLALLCRDSEQKCGIRFTIQEALLGYKLLSSDLKKFPPVKGIKRLPPI
jgi:hypothetical protein